MALKSIRWRLPLTYAAIALLSVLALGLVLISLMRSFYSQQERGYLEGNAFEIASLSSQLLQSDPSSTTLANQVSSWSFLLQARLHVLDNNGKVLADSGIPDNQQKLVVSSLPGPGILTSSINSTGPVTSKVQSGDNSGQVLLPPWGIFLQKLGANVQDCTQISSGAGKNPSITCQVSPSNNSSNQIVTQVPQGNIQISPGSSSSGQSATQVPSSQAATSTAQESSSGNNLSSTPVAITMQMSGSLFGFNLNPAIISSNNRSLAQIIQPITDNSGDILGSIIISDGPAYGDEIMGWVSKGWLVASLVAVVLSAGAGWWVSRRMTSPLFTLTAVTTSMAAGDLSARVVVQSKDEIGELGQAFNTMAGRVEEIVGTLRGFVADAAHQLMTPLTALRTNLELATDEANVDRRNGYLDDARKQMSRMETLVNGLLELSRIEANGFALAQEQFDLRQVVSEAAETAASRAEQTGRLFSLDLPEEPMNMEGDPSRIRHALDNLLDNALKYTSEGGSVHLWLLKEEEGAVAVVEDNGSEIPADDLPHLCERFHRGKNSVGIPGSGLGLAIVRAIVEMHKGSLTITSTEKGTKVEIHLPSA